MTENNYTLPQALIEINNRLFEQYLLRENGGRLAEMAEEQIGLWEEMAAVVELMGGLGINSIPAALLNGSVAHQKICLQRMLELCGSNAVKSKNLNDVLDSIGNRLLKQRIMRKNS